MVGKDYMAKYYINNKDKMKADHQKWVMRHREHIRRYMREYMKEYRQYKQPCCNNKKKKDHLKKKLEPVKKFNIKFTYKPIILYF